MSDSRKNSSEDRESEKEAGQKIKVLLVDDHTLFREGLRRVLELDERIAIAGEASSGHAAVAAALQHRPDVILMDLNIPEPNGIEASRLILKELPQVRILALTVEEGEQAMEALRAGVAAYLLKDIESQDLIRAIIDVYHGNAVVHPRVTARLVGELNRLSLQQPAQKPLLASLTPREKEVLKLIAQGEGNKEIAARLFISEKTVKNHITSILRKLGAKDRTQAAIFAIKNRLTEEN